jgi:hypothetical protein
MIAGVLSTRLVSAEEPATPPSPPRDERPAMTDERRAQMEERLNKEWSSLPLEGKVRLMRLHRALHQMPPEERKFVQDRVGRFLDMPPEERERLKKNREKWEKMTPEEREQARQKFRERRRQFEERWRQEHPGEEPPPFPFHRQKGPPPDAGETAPPPAPPQNDPAE